MDDFTPDEDVALLGLLREIITADGDYSDAERAQVEALRGEMGVGRFAVAMEVAQKTFGSRAELKAFAKSIERVAAQKAILGRLRKVAESDGIAPAEAKPLAWLEAAWPKTRA